MANAICNVCGADISPNMKLCEGCGAPIELQIEAATISASTPKRIRRFLIPAIILLGLIIIVTFIMIFTKKSKYETLSNIIFVGEIEDTISVYKKDKVIATMDGELYEMVYNLKQQKAAVLVRETSDDDDSSMDGYSLYIVTDKITLIADEVADCQISASGDGIAFTKKNGSDSETSELCLWRNGKVVTVTDAYVADGSYVISPDGKVVASTLLNDDEREGFYYNGEIISLGKDIVPTAISNDAKYVYYEKEDSFYVQKGAEEDTKNKLGENVNDYYFNLDLSQVVYSSNGKAYLSRNGGYKEILASDISSFLLPSDTVYDGSIIGVADFSDTFYINDSQEIAYIDGKYGADVILESVHNPQLANDGKTIHYLKDESIYKINGKIKYANMNEIVEEDVADFLATSDGASVYYATTDEELYYQKGTQKPVFVGDDPTNGFRNWTLYRDNSLLFINDDKLYIATGKKVEAVTEVEDEVDFLFNINIDNWIKGIIFVFNDNDNEYFYYSFDGSGFIRQQYQ
jgi:hypothetical protein